MIGPLSGCFARASKNASLALIFATRSLNVVAGADEINPALDCPAPTPASSA
jgi:hypothetical protein